MIMASSSFCVTARGIPELQPLAVVHLGATGGSSITVVKRLVSNSQGFQFRDVFLCQSTLPG